MNEPKDSTSSFLDILSSIKDQVFHQKQQIICLTEQIIHDKNSIFLNTLTGEIGPLEITASTDENGKIDFQKIRSADQALSLENNIAFKFSENEEDQKLKVKKLLHE